MSYQLRDSEASSRVTECIGFIISPLTISHIKQSNRKNLLDPVLFPGDCFQDGGSHILISPILNRSTAAQLRLLRLRWGPNSLKYIILAIKRIIIDLLCVVFRA
jgi:hypothetical protein